ncbi:uncharacterized protein LOC113681584, partial [Pocillopora damicornis]|uniref:uncharacterized protein LOC113681584 n=1 Tax=Pocillopora damicornis TaxID=46731 RepID=UPI000F552554
MVKFNVLMGKHLNVVGVLQEDLSLLGAVCQNHGKGRRLDRVEEMLLCERELYDNYARLEPLQVFLNLTFDKVCIDYYSLRKYKICVKGSIHVHVLKERLKNLICNMFQTTSVELYYWTACMESGSGRRVISKFGLNSHESEFFFLAPTSTRPVLMGCFS